MRPSTIASLTLLTSLSSALPSIIPRAESKTFALLYAGNSNAVPPPVGALNHGSWAVGVGSTGHAILVPNVGDAARLFYEYGPDDATSVGTASIGIMITPGGTATVPSTNVVVLENNNGTKGVEIAPTAEGLPSLRYDGGSFQACREGDELVLRYVKAGQRLFADCAKAELIAVCRSGGNGQQLGAPRSVECQSN